jgi:hypothetical protein
MSYVSDALSRITSQFERSPKVLALLSAIVGPLESLQSESDSVKTERWIDTAIGSQLDGCGYIVGETRQGRDDDAYRSAIRFRVFVNISEGTPGALIKGLDYLVDSDDKQYIEMYTATAILFANGPNVPVDIQAQIQDLAPAAISDVPVLVSYTELPFRFSKVFNNPKLRLETGDFLTANGLRIRVSSSGGSQSGPSLAGIALPCLAANGARLKIGGSKLRINSPNHNMVFGSDHNLTGVFQ